MREHVHQLILLHVVHRLALHIGHCSSGNVAGLVLRGIRRIRCSRLRLQRCIQCGVVVLVALIRERRADGSQAHARGQARAGGGGGGLGCCGACSACGIGGSGPLCLHLAQQAQASLLLPHLFIFIHHGALGDGDAALHSRGDGVLHACSGGCATTAQAGKQLGRAMPLSLAGLFVSHGIQHLQRPEVVGQEDGQEGARLVVHQQVVACRLEHVEAVTAQGQVLLHRHGVVCLQVQLLQSHSRAGQARGQHLARLVDSGCRQAPLTHHLHGAWDDAGASRLRGIELELDA